MKLSKVTRIAEKAPSPSIKDRFDQMQSKGQSLAEGPFDFIKGAAGEAGRKTVGAARGAASAVAQPVRDIAAAGANASAQANLEKAVANLAALLTKAGGAPERQEPTPDAQEQPSNQKPVDEPLTQPRRHATPDAFRSTSKPRGVSGKDGQDFQWTFNSYMAATHGDQLDEGVWDFVKGAGKEVGTKLRSAINSYADKPSVFKDIYSAGQRASQKGDVLKASQAQQALKGQIAQAQQQVQQLAAKLGPQALTAAIKKMGGAQANAIMKMMGQQGGSQPPAAPARAANPLFQIKQ